MQYQRFDPQGCHFPQPKVAILPALQRHSLGHTHASTFKPLGTKGNVSFFTRGRYAITEAFRLSGLDEGSTLLAPAYHCRTMLDPAIRLGADITLYPVNDDLSPDLNALAACLTENPKPVRVMLLTHYFGFPQNLQPVVDFCEQHAITLIEDCSHALFVKENPDAPLIERNQSVGNAGRYGVASPYKFFPMQDGGLLWSNASNEPPLRQQNPQPLLQELKSVVHILQQARISSSKAGAIENGKLLGQARFQTESASDHPLVSAGLDHLEASPRTSVYYNPDQEHLQSLAGSRWIMRHTDVQRLVSLRRQYYQQWLTAVLDMPRCRALLPDLPDDCVPYMFPLYIEHPNPDFFSLKTLGFPIWRWDDMAVSSCPVSSNYRLKILHLPCHQELTATQMNWMTTTLQQVMRAASQESPT